MKRFKIVGVVVVCAFFTAAAGYADHASSSSDCKQCHDVNSTSKAPKVIPEEPGFVAKLFGGKKSFAGHGKVSCSGKLTADGGVTGCHDPDAGNEDLLVTDLSKLPVDELCGKCHDSQRQFGAHHPSYKMDKNGDGVGEYLVRPVEGQEVLGVLAPANMPEPVKSYPDALKIIVGKDGKNEVLSAMPLEKIIEVVDGEEVVYENVVTCTTCHNPHFGFLVAMGEDEAIETDAVAREEGDALLRFRDHDNTLCLACH